ncbi:MAG TPA: MFS transporter, partial [Microthrixaceae bacterium]|nr:MFS transporter [Microthrixaceae bacterium]
MRSLNRLAVLAVANLALVSGITVVLPLLPELQEQNGLSTTQLGIVAGVSFFAGLVGQLGLARYVDRGYARHLLIAAAITTAISLVGISLARGLWDLVAARFVEGLGYAMFTPAARTVVAAHDPSRMGTNLGRLSGAELAGVVVGPMLGAILAQAFGLHVPFLVLAVVMLALLPLLWTLDLGHLEDRPIGTASVRSMVRRPPVARAALLYMAMILPSGVYDVLWALYLTDRGASQSVVGLSFAIYALPYVAVAAFGAHVIDRIGPLRASYWGLAVTLVPILAYGLIHRPWVLIAVATIEGVANAVSIPAAQAAMVEACPPDEVGTGQGIAGAAGIGAAGVAAVCAAPLYDQTNAFVTFAVTAAVMALAAVVAGLIGARSPARWVALSPSGS